MVFVVKTTTAAHRIIKKYTPKLKEEILKHCEVIANNPYTSLNLESPFNYIKSYHFSYAGTDYRIAYEIDEKNKQIIVHLVAPRENFYKRLRRTLFFF